MKRLALTVTATIAGLIALLSFKTQTHPLSNAAALPSAALGTGSSSAATTSGSAASTSAASTSAAPAGAPGSSASSSAASSAAKTYVGTAITTRYGVVQVVATVSGSKITDVGFKQLTAFDPHSQEINSWAGPQLLKETLSAQSAHVDTVSGASYTTDGYVQSLQSALDQAGIR